MGIIETEHENKELQMLTLEELKEWNPLYKPRDIAQEINEEDLAIANEKVNAMEQRRSDGLPTPGDIVEFTNPYGKRTTGVLEYTCGAFHVGEDVSGYIGCDGNVCLSGGPFWNVESISALIPAGTEKRRFWTFGRFGACAHGGIYFNVTVNKWIMN